MIILAFTAINPCGELNKCTFGGPDDETCFKALSRLVKQGWHLTSIEWFDHAGGAVSLPVEAFNGDCLTGPLKQLQSQWKDLLLKT